jgi:hypothetical protein
MGTPQQHPVFGGPLTPVAADIVNAQCKASLAAVKAAATTTGLTNLRPTHTSDPLPALVDWMRDMPDLRDDADDCNPHGTPRPRYTRPSRFVSRGGL